MKVFLSWSGNQSHEVAKLLDNWIRCVLQVVEPWLSSRDIDRGALWFTEINSQLSSINNGIVCLTKENINNPWILFESGALAKGLESNRIFTFLVDLEPKDVRDPLAQFNHTIPTKNSLYNLILSINKGLEKSSLNSDILNNVFETYWPQFKENFDKIIEETPEQETIEDRSQEDILNEVLYSVRGIDKRLRYLENEKPMSRSLLGNNQKNSDFYSKSLLNSSGDNGATDFGIGGINSQRGYFSTELNKLDKNGRIVLTPNQSENE